MTPGYSCEQEPATKSTHAQHVQGRTAWLESAFVRVFFILLQGWRLFMGRPVSAVDADSIVK